MPTWKSPVSAASLPSSTRSYGVPAASWSRTTAAISRATSAGPKRDGSASTWTAAVQPTAERGAQLLDRVGGAERQHGRLRRRSPRRPATASSTAHSSWALIVKPA